MNKENIKLIKDLVHKGITSMVVKKHSQFEKDLSSYIEENFMGSHSLVKNIPSKNTNPEVIKIYGIDIIITN